MANSLTVFVLAADALFKVLSADDRDRRAGFRLDGDFRLGLGGGRGGDHSRVHLGLLAGFTGGGGRGDSRGGGGRGPLAGPGPVGSLGEALNLEGLCDLEELIQLLLGHVDFSVVHEVENVLHVIGGDSSENGIWQ